jgi:hypothetical protein
MKNIGLLVCILLLAIINIALFWPGNLYFLNDDLLHIPLTDQGRLFQTNSVRPVHELLVKLDLFLWSKQAYGYHITTLLLQSIVCFQLYHFTKWLQTKWLQIQRWQAVQAALLTVTLFLAYPQSSESLAWIIGRAPILSAIFLIIALRLFFDPSGKAVGYLLSAVCFAAALFTYEQSVLLPIALLLVALIEKEQLKKRRQLTCVMILATTDVAYIVVRKLVTGEVLGHYEGANLVTMNWDVLIANGFRLLFRLVLNPADKSAFIITIALLLLVVAYVLIKTRTLHADKRPVMFFTTMIALLVVPVVSLGLPANSFESGRFLYLPSMFFIISMSIAAVSAYHKNKNLQKPLIALFTFLSCYWLFGKYTAAQQYKEASLYAKSVEHKVLLHFANSSDTLYIDTLRTSIHQLPVFRSGFKTGIHWFNPIIDTNKIVVKHYYE